MNVYFFTCPYCWQNISMLIDMSIEKQFYIEDCETCCNPIQVSCYVFNNELASFEANSIEQ
jgi:hypothetical protein